MGHDKWGSQVYLFFFCIKFDTFYKQPLLSVPHISSFFFSTFEFGRPKDSVIHESSAEAFRKDKADIFRSKKAADAEKP